MEDKVQKIESQDEEIKRDEADPDNSQSEDQKDNQIEEVLPTSQSQQAEKDLGGGEVDLDLIQKIKRQQDKLQNLPGNKKLQGKGYFWNTQPVPRLEQINDQVQLLEGGPIDSVKTPQEIRQEGYKLPESYEWVEIDLNDEEQINQVYTLLSENYVEDDDNMFRFDYSVDFLRWALQPPHHLQFKEWIVGVKVKKSQKLVGFITGIPVNMVLEGNTKKKMTEINFLCVNKKLRNNRLAPVLIKEITRRVNLKDIWQAVYTAGVVVPTPIAKARYYHRSLNPKKLIEVNFSSLNKNQTIARLVKLYKLPEQTNIKGIREMKKKDISQIQKLLNNYLAKFQLYQKFTDEEVKHFLLPRPDVIYTYVVENDDKVVTDFLSFYYLPSTIIKHPVHKLLRAVYSFYNVATSVSFTKLMENALILAKQQDFDVFNALDIMDNQEFLKELKFSPGDGNLHFYLYNWRLSKQLDSKELGMVLV